MLRNRPHQALLGLFVISMAIAPATQAADGTCGIDSLKGRYGFQASGRVDVPTNTETGTDFSKTETVHFAHAGTLDADGEGNAWIKLTESGDKIPSSTGQIGATYTVNPDCTGTVRFLVGDSDSKASDSAPGYAFVLKPDNTFSFISTVAGAVLTGSAWQINDTAVLANIPLSYTTGNCGVGCPPHRLRIPGTQLCWIPC